MRICSLGDVHGNAAALRAVLAAVRAEDPDLVCCVGDVVLGWGAPEECVDAVAALGGPWVSGNAEQSVLGAPGYRVPPGSRRERQVAWERERLGPGRLRRLAALPAACVLRFRDAAPVWIVHGAPPDRITPGVRPTGLHEWDDVLDDAAVRAALGPEPPGLLLCGHTHVPTLRRIGPTLVVNAGSTGFGIHPDAPARYRTGNAWARYAVVESRPDGGWQGACRRVPYDPEEAVAGLAAAPWADPAFVEEARAFLRAPASAAGPDPVS
jgi:predicted phosphodiesterase